MFSNNLMVAIGGLAAVLLQVLVAPNIAIFHAIPNVLVVYTLLIAMLVPGQHFVLAFVLGMLSDLLGYGPVGAMPLLLIVASALASRVHMAFDNGTVFIPLVVLAVSIILVEVLYAFIAVGAAGVDPMDAFIYRALPCTLYNCVLGLALYPFMWRLFGKREPQLGSVMPGPHLQ